MNTEMKNFEEELEIKKAEEEIKKADKHITTKIELLTLLLAILTICVFILIIVFANIVYDNGKKAEEESIEKLEKEKEIKALLSAVDARDKEIEELNKRISEADFVIKEADEELENRKSEIDKLYNDNKSMKEEIDEFDSDIQDLKDRVEKYEQYDYALFNKYTGERNDLNYDYIKLLEELTLYKPVNDIDLYLSWINIESEGIASAKNPNSTAKGFGQFLDSTSQSVYNTYLVDKYQLEWYPNIVIDHPDIALDMMVEYVNYLYIECGRSIPDVIDCYRGLHDTPYLNALNKLLANNGKSINSINLATEERYQELQTAVG